ncbi:uncharacterized protein LOC123523651 isoform X2 [Mercenaria mercenaria]|uniref:uncharacterized protein LOC123523651 isoform X2 n=1 Tax=Mercenaria mercenaria TaxID=6596 RepID=UPI001E1D8C69|nr:uncharacterized protein LOC123523651 isoform X2 [Mercenaria mercenaria]
MAEKRRPGVKLKDVKPIAEDGKNLSSLKCKSDNAVANDTIADRNKSRLFHVKPREISEHERQLAEIDSSFREVELTFVQHVKDVSTAKEERVQGTKNEATEDQKRTQIRNERTKKKKRIKKNAVLPLDVTKSGYLDRENDEDPTKELNIGEPDTRNGKKSSKKKSEKNKKEEKKEPVAQTTEASREQQQEIVAAPRENGEHADDKRKTRKLPSCFGFISTRLAIRKQKRRDKKKKAIANRYSPLKLVQYEHKKARGGEAFVVEVDCRPINIQKPLLPPIKQTAGPIRRGTDFRLQAAEARRAIELAKRRENARNYERKKTECKERKANADYHFRKKADLTIRYKQADAERNRNNLSCLTIATRTASIQSSSCESLIIESDPNAFKVDESDADAWKIDDFDCISN